MQISITFRWSMPDFENQSLFCFGATHVTLQPAAAAPMTWGRSWTVLIPPLTVWYQKVSVGRLTEGKNEKKNPVFYTCFKVELALRITKMLSSRCGLINETTEQCGIPTDIDFADTTDLNIMDVGIVCLCKNSLCNAVTNPTTTTTTTMQMTNPATTTTTTPTPQLKSV